jgi:hypothetical protein
MRAIWGLISGRDTKLMAWDEVRDKLKLRGLIYRGIQTVLLDKIVGSVGRYRDFDDEFLPTQNQSADRWRKVNRAFYEDVSLPPVQLYKVGEVYFVLDGNHRVSVAREHGAAYIDAEVQEAAMRVNITEDDIDANNLEMLGEVDEFLRRTQLDKLRPEQNVRFSIGGAYVRVLEHIAVHRYYMGLEQKRPIGEDEAVVDWYDKVYLPIVKAVREHQILEDFPGRTEGDLYMWMVDHQHYLRVQCGECNPSDVTAEEAVTDYAEKFGEKPPVLKRVAGAVSEFIESL